MRELPSYPMYRLVQNKCNGTKWKTKVKGKGIKQRYDKSEKRRRENIKHKRKDSAEKTK
jgi:hypothetical protein